MPPRTIVRQALLTVVLASAAHLGLSEVGIGVQGSIVLIPCPCPVPTSAFSTFTTQHTCRHDHHSKSRLPSEELHFIRCCTSGGCASVVR
eukprot:8676347-Pyramimonas_sp.AAC.1